ncbi:glycosyltransferase [Marinifilum flexuosum]|uniref:Glycosyltransferase involved in cell wall biosynthesis n=1 Tax=Marinifilum flexuosum TaxID=1117708 RepID=A0A419XA16_9BACT|nr:glycosyltransferase [Marinifilum flexuosum]RKE04604.1 glycosyltransferase involved in cell wall biosynthesis [Marinifilum flexuosum]
MNKILFVTAYMPSDIGAAVKYTKSILDKLSKKYCIDLIYFTNKGDENEYNNCELNSVKSFDVSNWSRLAAILSKPLVYPLFSVRYSLKVKEYIKKMIDSNSYDLVFFDHSQTFIYGKDIDKKKILMSHDVILQRTQRSSLKVLSKLCRKTESEYLSDSNSTVFTFSEKDADLIRDIYNIKAICTNANIDENAIKSRIDEVKNYYVSFGYWKRPDNYEGLLWFVKNIFPKINNGKTLKVIGGGMSDKHKRILSEYKGVELLGFVDNPYNIIANSEAMISPIFSGAGVKFKNLEALACGTPIIGTEIAFEGISRRYSSFMLEANSIDEFIHQISSKLPDIDQRRNMKDDFTNSISRHEIIEYIDNYMNKLNK